MLPSGLKQIPVNTQPIFKQGGNLRQNQNHLHVVHGPLKPISINLYYNAMRKISEIFEEITFTENILSKEEISDLGYLAQISVLQTSAKANFDFHGTGANFIFFS